LEYVIGYCVVILKVAFGLGFVIFVHELGHFLVAKLCGVKCEKFYLGFDIAGWKLCKFRWGETEYGIGILPLGGYVKMLGQEDNPAKLREEIERAKQLTGETADLPDDSTPLEAEQALYDPRSYLAQSVPKRMAIISAGVVMNVIFAFLMAVAAFWMGVKDTPCAVGGVFPGEPAWQADLRVGDEILEIAGKKMTKFRDLQTAISLGDIDPDKGVPFTVRRPGVEEPLTIVVKPDRSRGAFIVGITGPSTTQLALDRKTWLVRDRRVAQIGSAADRAEPPFCNGDKIVRINDKPIDNYAQINRELAQIVDQPITVTVQRDVLDAKGKPTGKTKDVAIAVPPNPMRHLGLVMKMGEVTAIQANSPAVVAGILPGDVLDNLSGDPMTLPGWLRRRAGETVDLNLQREGVQTPVTTQARLRRPIEFANSEILNGPVGAPALGIAYQVLNRVDSVTQGSPAAKAGLRSGDVLISARLIPPDEETLEKPGSNQLEIEILFDETKRNWPALIGTLQKLLPGTTVELTFSRQEKEQTVTLTPVESAEWFNPDRGLLFEPETFDRKANNLGEAFVLGGQETSDALTIVFRTVGKLSTNQVSPRLLGGPWMILKMALLKADEGNAKLLLFLTLLSANLAVLNFLPIPLLDGGHFVLLCYEGIRGKPADERVQVVLTYLGLAFILGLMAWVVGLDFGLISRR